MTELARLRDVCISDREPEAAVFCTYGFDARFFETEVLPAVFPLSLSFDRDAGSLDAYLHSADELLARRSVSVFYDHIDEGPELNYAPRRFAVAGRAFHPKLILLDYGDEIRAAIGSANLTRAGWTRLLEIFRVERLVPGEPHPWAGGLQRFLGRLATIVPESQASESLLPGLDDVPAGGGSARVVSSWDEPLLEALLAGFERVRRVEAVSPFFEGADGEGVFDQLRKKLGPVRGRLHVAASRDEGRVTVCGPPEKLDQLIKGGGWTLSAVDGSWEGDEEGAPSRVLHGKLLGLVGPRRARLMTGSANLTRAALLASAPRTSAPPRHGESRANVELVVIEDCSKGALERALPQSTPLAGEEVEIVDRGEADDEDAELTTGAERFVAAASYSATAGRLELELAPDAPELRVSYDGERLITTFAGTKLSAPLELALPRYVGVEADTEMPGIVPFVIVDPQAVVPRGRARDLGLEDFLEMLAGNREEVSPPGEPGGRAVSGAGVDGGLPAIVGGAIPWRRIISAIAGIGRDLERELPVPRGVRFTLENPSRLAGLVDRLEQAHSSERGRLGAADLAYALYEIERVLRRVGKLEAPPESRQLLEEAAAKVATRRGELESALAPLVLEQLALLARTDRR